MSGMVDAITGKGARKQASLVEAAQAAQQRELDKQAADVAAIEAGQAKLRKGASNLGLVSYVDEQLKKKLG